VLRGAGRGETRGMRYEFPPSMTAHQAAFDELVVGNPLARLRGLASGGKAKEAMEEVKRISAKLAALASALEAERAEFSNVAARGEMLRRTVARQADLRAFERSLAKPGAAGEPAGTGAEPGVDAEYAAVRELCASLKKSEQDTFARIADTYRGSFFGLEYETRPGSRETIANIKRLDNLRELYSQWEPELDRLRRLGAQLKRPPEEIAAVAPDRERFQRFRNEGRIQTATGKAPH
jgi:hypothetical protein